MTYPDKTLENGDILKFIDYHHASNPTNEKSIWTIKDALAVEEYLVQEIINKHYYLQNSNKQVGYNLYNKNVLNILGKDHISDKLYVSKFIKQDNYWHGFPVNYQNKNSDKPSVKILSKLLINNVIDKTQMKRIERGKPL